ncbi:helix-turn-helix domain-containing protein [Luteolibacter arcticus]|uniref:Helix-turn-helix domain-containing protein n=1 Tax=Luteolibacter arcticus TaxID=1581411 RepID=A0ABT3GIN3_9BACT|nr:helix-turn-helix domain-containing protein [Luteolibacter arcticus]MCW1923368.1 helix-turn-helix domain-containing protein [Luteolibacter arcticus]
MSESSPKPVSTPFEATLHERLKASDLFRVYQDAFRTATGLPLRLVGANPDDWCLDDQAVNRSPFCEVLNLCKSACQACVETNRRLIAETRVNGPSSCHCFAGLTASAVPVKLGKSIVGFLKTGQVFSRTPDDAQFEEVLGRIGRKTLDEGTQAALRVAYLQTRSVEPERYASMITLLQSFADQLGRHAESLAIIEEGREPAAIAKARRYIHEHLDDPLPLGDVAREAGLSESHFCRLFKEATGLTLTDYVNRCRIERAKNELLKSDRRVSEIAFEVGFQSLSQFNRSFSRITGHSPTTWRQDRLKAAAE